MTESEIREALRDRVLKRVAEATGIGHNTLVRLKLGHVKPHRSTLARLEEYLTR